MNRYIITEEQIGRWCGCISTLEAEKIMEEVLSNPYNPQADAIYTPGDIIEMVKDWQKKIDAEREGVLDELEQRVTQELMDKRYTSDSKGAYIAVLAWIGGLKAGGKL